MSDRDATTNGENAAPLLPLRGEPCSLCEGAACEEQCGRRTGCRAMSGGPDDHRVCTRCGGRGTQSGEGRTDALREAIADAVGPNLSVFGSSPGAQEFADGVCDSIVDDVLEALGLEHVGWFRPDLADGQFEPLSTYRLADRPHEPVYRTTHIGSSAGDDA